MQSREVLHSILAQVPLWLWGRVSDNMEGLGQGGHSGTNGNENETCSITFTDWTPKARDLVGERN